MSQAQIQTQPYSFSIKKITQELIEKVKSNDKTFTKFIKENEGFVHSIVKKFNPNNFFDYDEYYQIGLISLHKALDKFDPSRSTLSTFAYHCIYNDILQYVNKENNKKNNEISMESFLRTTDYVNGSEYNEMLFNDFSRLKINFEEVIINNLTIEEFFNKLEDLHKDIFYYRIILKMKHEDVAKKVDLNLHTYKHIWHYHVKPKIKQFQKQQQG